MVITVDQLFREMRFGSDGKFFSVVFERRTNSRRNTQGEGDIRRMLCRTQMNAYQKGRVSQSARDEEDFQHGIITVWSMDAFIKQRQAGTPKDVAGYQSYRRVDIMGIREISLLKTDEIEIQYHPWLHDLSNEFRLSHMPSVVG